MKQKEFKYIDAKMYHSAKKLIATGGVCTYEVDCISCPAYFNNRIDNITHCLGYKDFKDREGEEYHQRRINYCKEFVELYEKENKEEGCQD